MIRIEASFDALIKFDNITAIWQNHHNSKQIYLIYTLEGAKVRYDLPEKNLRYFCWLSPEKHSELDINALPLIKGEKIEIGISGDTNRSNHNAKNINKNLHIFQLADQQHSLVLGLKHIPFSKLVCQNCYVEIIEFYLIYEYIIYHCTYKCDKRNILKFLIKNILRIQP